MVPPGYGGRVVVGKYDTTGVSRAASDATLSPTDTWRLCLELLNQRPLIRLAERRSTSVAFPRRLGRRVERFTDAPPSQPVAVHVYDAQGRTRFLPLDFDAHDRTGDQIVAVENDLAVATSLLDECGFIYLVDRAHGGAHIYVLLEEPLGAQDAHSLVLALGRRLPTLDLKPTSNVSDGLITIPGSAHKRGGHRELAHDADSARAIAAGPHSPARALTRLRAALADELRALLEEDRERGAERRTRAREAGSADPIADAITEEEIRAVLVRGIGRHMSTTCTDLAQRGDWRAHGYPSASEARRAVLMSAIATGLTETDVRARMLGEEPQWPGLRSLLEHKGLDRLRDEYARAAAEIARRERQKAGRVIVTRDDTAVSSDTSANTHTRGGGDSPSVHDTYGVIRAWITLVERYAAGEYPGAQGWDYQMALRALGQAASTVGSTVTAMGVRWHSVALGDSRTGAAALLRALAAEDDPWVVLVARGRGIYADQYELRIPDRHASLVEELRWRPGKTQAVRPVFTVLGKATGLLFEAVERGATSRARIALVTGLSDDAYRDARDTALAYGLITGNDRDGYELAADDARLELLAQQLGAIEARVRRIHQHRRERAAYWAKLEQLRRERPWIRVVRDVDETDPEVEETLAQMYLDSLDEPPGQAREAG